MDYLGIALHLAQAADATNDALPAWAKWVLGPVGALVLMGIYAYRTETIRIPALADLLKAEQKENDELRDRVAKSKDEGRAEMRAEMQPQVDEIKNYLKKCRDKYTKERSARAWWQAKAEALGAKSDQIPKDIDKTFFAGFDGGSEDDGV